MRLRMTIAVIVAICIILLILAFVAPRLSRGPESATHRAFGTGVRAAGKAPGPLGRLLAKPVWSSSKAAGKSASAGRKGRSKMPM
ncbi:MAG: hypothetical protein QOG77_3029 [Solirubrobacteraceae bacterium]|nr:hypothetical protein [Solirubrobacteraceae bacterium]